MLGWIARDRSVSSSKDPSGASLEGCFISGSKIIFVVEPLAMRNILSRLPSSEVSLWDQFIVNRPSCFLYSTSLPYRWLHNMLWCCLAIISGLFSLRKKGSRGNNLYLLLGRSYIIKDRWNMKSTYFRMWSKARSDYQHKKTVRYDLKFPCFQKRNKENWDVPWGGNNNRVTTTERGVAVTWSYQLLI